MRWRRVPVGPRVRCQVQVEVIKHRRELAAWLAVFEAAIQTVADVVGEPSDFAIASDHRSLLRIVAAQGAVAVAERCESPCIWLEVLLRRQYKAALKRTHSKRWRAKRKPRHVEQSLSQLPTEFLELACLRARKTPAGARGLRTTPGATPSWGDLPVANLLKVCSERFNIRGAS
jgi:hypothetical protein